MTEENEQVQREAADSQQESPQDSGLQTPQPDQRMPTEEERSERQTPVPGQTVAAPSDQTVDTEDGPRDAPAGYEPQVPLAPGQTGEMVERPGEQTSDVEEATSDQVESDASQGDDQAVDSPDNSQSGQSE